MRARLVVKALELRFCIWVLEGMRMSLTELIPCVVPRCSPKGTCGSATGARIALTVEPHGDETSVHSEMKWDNLKNLKRLKELVRNSAPKMH